MRKRQLFCNLKKSSPKVLGGPVTHKKEFIVDRNLQFKIFFERGTNFIESIAAFKSEAF